MTREAAERMARTVARGPRGDTRYVVRKASGDYATCSPEAYLLAEENGAALEVVARYEGGQEHPEPEPELTQEPFASV